MVKSEIKKGVRQCTKVDQAHPGTNQVTSREVGVEEEGREKMNTQMESSQSKNSSPFVLPLYSVMSHFSFSSLPLSLRTDFLAYDIWKLQNGQGILLYPI